jgi:uncharacterized damage-inducible protein DinB
METIKLLLQALGPTPHLLEDMIRRIPSSRLKARRAAKGWSIHTHACHLVGVQPMLYERLQRFTLEEHPTFTPYFPDKAGEDPEGALLRLDLETSLKAFHDYRRQLMHFAAGAPNAFWEQKATHPEYDEYTPLILLRHMLMHEHLHMYRIETLWLTRDEYLTA